MNDTIESMHDEFVDQNVLNLEAFDDATLELIRDSFFCGAGAALAMVADVDEDDRLARMKTLGKEFLRFALTLDLHDDDREMVESHVKGF